MSGKFSGSIGTLSPGLLSIGRYSFANSVVILPAALYVSGLEAVFTYNELELNTKNSPDSYKITKISGLYDADIRDLREIRPNQHGEIAYHSYYSGRTIIINGEIRAGNLSKLRNMIRDLQIAFNDFSELPLTLSIPNFDNIYINCKKMAALDIEEANDSLIPKRNFMISLRAKDPRFYSETLVTTEIIPSGIGFEGRTYNLDYSRAYDEYSADSDSAEVENVGGFSNSPVMKIYGPCLNPTIYNTTTNTKLIFECEISDGDYYEINLFEGAIIDSLGNSRTSSLSATSDNFYIDVGQNIINFIVGSYNSSTKLEIFSRNSWI